jgi:hypothetical protein
MSYTNTTNGCTFIAPLLHKGNEIESGELSYLPCPYISSDKYPDFTKKCMKEYLNLVKNNSRIALRKDPLLKYNNEIISSILRNDFSTNMFYTSIIDLTLDYSELWANLRKRYHSFINKFKNKNSEYTFILVDSLNSDSFINDWIELYSTLLSRSKKSININLNYIANDLKNNFGKLYLLYKNKKLISGVNINHTKEFAYYSAAGIHPEYEGHDYFSHFLMWEAIVDLKNMGIKKLEIGPLFFNNVHNFYNHSEKELSITQFKLGFGGSITPFIIFEYKHK